MADVYLEDLPGAFVGVSTTRAALDPALPAAARPRPRARRSRRWDGRSTPRGSSAPSASRARAGLPLVVTENGIATADDASAIAYMRDPSRRRSRRRCATASTCAASCTGPRSTTSSGTRATGRSSGSSAIDRDDGLRRDRAPEPSAMESSRAHSLQCSRTPPTGKWTAVRRASASSQGRESRSCSRHRSPAGTEPGRLRDPRDLLRRRPRDRVRGEALHQDEPRLLPLGPLAARVDHRPGLHLGQPGRARDPRHGGQRRAVRHLHGPLLLDRRGAGHGLPRHRDDAVLLRVEGAVGPSTCACASTSRRTSSTR